MTPDVLLVPYHLGQREQGPGLGPAKLAQAAGLRGHEVHGLGGTDEVTRVGAVNRALAAAVRKALAPPLVLSGDCNSALGTLAGLSAPAAVLWFDAHGDFNTPATSPSGFLDGMALAMLAGRCHEPLWRDQPWLPVRPRHVVHIAGRAFDPGERGQLSEAGVLVVDAEQLRKGGLHALAPALDELATEVRDAYVHVDLDALDTSEGRPNRYAAPGGIARAELEAAIALVAERFRVRAAAIAAYDPAADADGRALRAGVRVAASLQQALG